MPSLYSILGVTPDSEPEVIDAAYRTLMKKFHPDVSSAGERRCREINEAYSVLKDERKRRAYDAELTSKRSKVLAPSEHVPAAGEGSQAHPQASSATKSCPDCAERVQQRARVCRYCGYQFDSNAEKDDAVAPKRELSFVLVLLSVVGVLLFVLWLLGIPPMAPVSDGADSAEQPVGAPSDGSAGPPAATATRSHLASTDANTSVAANKWRGKKGRCRLIIGSTSYLQGQCWIRLDRDGSFQIMSLDEQYFAQLFRDERPAIAYWNGAAGSQHAQEPLGAMTRHGACWENTRAQLCAWAGG